MEESRHPLDAIFRPRSVAVVGTSRDKASLGREILSNILSYEFEGVVFPVNPRAKVVSSLKCYPSVSAIPDPVDLAVVVVPRDNVLEVVEDAAKKGVQGMVIVTAGLSLPLWGPNYRDSMGAARAEGAAHRADRDAARLAADAHLEAALSAVRGAQRRIDLYRDTLIPQAETTFQSVLGGYQSGQSTVAAALLAQRDLLELQLELAQSRADHARAWAVLEAVVGRSVTTEERGEQP